MMIQLDERWTEKPQSYLLHELWIRKSRYQDAALGRHQYKIRDYGLEVFPSIHFQVHQRDYMAHEYARSLKPRDGAGTTEGENRDVKGAAGVYPSIIDHICDVRAGDSVVLLGPRGPPRRSCVWIFSLVAIGDIARPRMPTWRKAFWYP